MIIQKIKNGLDSKYYLPIISFFVLILWFIPYLLQERFGIYGMPITIIEGVGLCLMGFVALFLLIFYQEIFYAIPIITFVPFMFSHPFGVYTSPICLYIAIFLLAIGLIFHFIYYKVKLKFGSFLSGIVALGIGIILGGINVKTDARFSNLLIVITCVIGFVILYIFLSSTIQVKYEELARLITYLGLILVVQSICYGLVQPEGIMAIFTKKMTVGWGISNNVALILLFTSPFTLYLSLSNEKKTCVYYFLLTILQFIIIILTYSRGAMLSLAIGLCFMIPLAIIKAKDRKTIIHSMLILVCVLLVFVLVFSLAFRDLAKKFIDELFEINFDTLNSRLPIYKNSIQVIKEYPIFGRGILSNFNEDGEYIWGHSTYLQTGMTMGIVGIILLTIHMIQKYFYLIRHAKLWQLATLFGFAMSDLYGLFDVSYYFINYMLILVVVLVSIENLIDEPLFLYHKIKSKNKKQIKN